MNQVFTSRHPRRRRAALCRLPFTLLLAALLAGQLALAGTATASEVENLYSGEVLVGATPPAESTLVRQAFIAMLVKLTGERDPLQYNAIADSLDDAARMATRSGFISHDPPAAVRDSIISQGGTVAQRQFRASFVPAKVDQWLQRRQIPRWSPERSPFNIWLVYEQEGERRFVFEHNDPLRWLVQQTAQQRGLPLRWPQPLDPTLDVFIYNEALSAAWAGFHEDLPGAGEHMLLAAAQPLRDTWRVRWRQLLNGELVTYVTEAGDLASALQDGIHQAASRAATRGMIRGSSSGQQLLHLRVRGINTSADYSRVLRELQQLSQTETVTIDSAQGDRLDITLSARAGRDWLLRALTVNQILAAEPPFGHAGTPRDNTTGASTAQDTVIDLRLVR